MSDLGRDLRVAVRRLARRPGVSIVIIATMAICLGAATALFSVIESVLLDPWPYQGFDRIVVFRGDFPARGETEGRTWSVPEFNEIAAQDRIFDHVMAGQGRSVTLTDGDRPERLHTVAITASAFPMLGVQPLLGRAFTPQEDRPGAGRVVVMSHSLWQQRYASDPRIVGERLVIEGEPYTVIGVMPERFRWWNAALWFPLQLDRTQTDRSARNVTVQARLRQGVDMARAEGGLNSLARRWEAEYGTETPDYRGFTFQLRSLTREVLQDVRPALYVLLGFVALLLVIGCINVANLLMAQAIERRKEVAVYMALGSGRARLLRQLLLESLVLAGVAGALGLLLTFWGMRFIVALIPPIYIPAETEIDVDGWTFLFAGAGSVLAAALYGAIPAFQALRVSHTELVKEGGTRGAASGLQAGRVRSALVVAEVALATVLLVAAGLMIRTFLGMVNIDPGFDHRNVLSVQVTLPQDRYGEAHQVNQFFNRLSDRVGALPGVQSIAATSSLPLSGGTATALITVEGRSGVDVGGIPTAAGRVVTPDYFRTMAIPVLQGRDFSPGDVLDGQPVVIVNRTMVRRFWSGEDPLGRRFKIGGPDSDLPWMTVVGVVGDVRDEGLDADFRQLFYLPHAQRADRVRSMTIVVRTQVPPEELIEPVRTEVQRIDPLQPVHGIRTLETVWLESLGAKPLALTLLSVFAVVALVLALVGIFAVMAYRVTWHTGEIGIRMALGAGRREVVRKFVRQGVRLTLAGVVVGVLVGLAASQTISGFVYGVSTSDPVTLALAAIAFCLLGALGSYIPARRAANVDPAVALRHE